jgi:hypothetical protein
MKSFLCVLCSRPSSAGSGTWRFVALLSFGLFVTSCSSLFRDPRQVTIEKARNSGAVTLCGVEEVASCVNMNKAGCMTEARPYVEACIQETLSLLPDHPDKQDSSHWTRNLGRCLPKKFLPAMKAQGKLKPECPYL